MCFLLKEKSAVNYVFSVFFNHYVIDFYEISWNEYRLHVDEQSSWSQISILIILIPLLIHENLRKN
jgi:hypothetical protein